MRSPQWKVYDPDGEYIASCVRPEHAAVLVSVNGTGASIRWEHKYTVWIEGSEESGAGESYDRVADVIIRRAQSISAYYDACSRGGAKRPKPSEAAAWARESIRAL